jgi:HK97 family phage prohead protease
MLPSRDKLLRRFADVMSGVPATYNQKDHTVEAVLSTGAAVQRAYGTEILRISPQAVDLSRMEQAGIPFLDHHQQGGIDQILGRITDAWIERSVLMGRIKFNQTEQGKKAEGMIARGEVTGVSAGYRVEKWEITDTDGDVVDERNVRWNDDLTFTATRWQLFEASLVGVPADGEALVRGMPLGTEYLDLESVRARMRIRHRMLRRHMKVLGHG